MNDFKQYVDSHLLRRITIGKSGADVYELDNGCIAKHIRRRDMLDSLWESYKREYLFYTYFSSKDRKFLPEIYHCCCYDDEIQIIMKKYRPMELQNLDDNMLEKILFVLTRIHSLPIPDFLPQGEREPLRFEQADIWQYRNGWQAVLDEHGQAFSEYDLSVIAENINAVNQKFHCKRQWCCHGDFHFENLLTDEQENIIVCDWQGVGPGHVAGDISFLLSRLSADGCSIRKEKAIRIYCGVSDMDIAEDEIAIQMSLSNLNTAFMFWHHYLHGCSRDRVNEILIPMIGDMKNLLAC